jgi:hypothetical protein
MALHIKCLVDTSMISDETPESCNVRMQAGLRGSAQPTPQETIQTRFSPATWGPPESPWQGPFPPPVTAAQIMFSVLTPLEAWAESHWETDTIFTVTAWSWVGSDDDPDERVPQPLTTEAAPAAGSARVNAIGWIPSRKVNGTDT